MRFLGGLTLPTPTFCVETVKNEKVKTKKKLGVAMRAPSDVTKVNVTCQIFVLIEKLFEIIFNIIS